MPEIKSAFRALKVASTKKRILAYIIDNVIVLLVEVIILSLYLTPKLSLYFGEIDLSPENMASLTSKITETFGTEIFIVSYLVFFAYYMFMWLGTKKTIGNSLLKIELYFLNPSSSFWGKFLQVLLKVCLLDLGKQLFYIPFLFKMKDIPGERFHDKFSGTIMIDSTIGEIEDITEVKEVKE